MMPKIIKRNNCRICKSTDLVKFLSLGSMPHAGSFPKKEQLSSEKSFPLEVYFCKNCTLVQLLDIIPREELFRDYRYSSSTIKVLSEHFRKYAEVLQKRFNLSSKSLVAEFGSNDGVLLAPLKERGIKVIGVDPAENITKTAISLGIDVINDYFSQETAFKIINKSGKVDIITSSNTFAHIDDIDEVAKAIKILLKDDGAYVLEAHYLLDLIEKLQYDTIYHEHLCYYSLHALVKFFDRFNMEIFDVERIPIHAGSIRVFVKNKDSLNYKISENVRDLLSLEKERGLDNLQTYLEFSKKVKKQKKELLRVLREIKRQGKKIIGYGAAGRGNTLLNYCKIGKNILDYVVDESAERQNRFIPGMKIPIYPVQRMEEDHPDYALMTAWSYEKDIIEKEKEWISKGGKFIIPLPKVRIYPDKTTAITDERTNNYQ